MNPTSLMFELYLIFVAVGVLFCNGSFIEASSANVWCSLGAPSDIGDTRSCFTCRFTTQDGVCNHTQTCAETQGICITQISYTEDDSWVTRACSRLTICANSEENNADECYWDDPTSYGFEGKCSFCCTGDNCNDRLPSNFVPHGDVDVELEPRAGPGKKTPPGSQPKPGGTTRPKPGGTTHPKPGGTTRPKPGRTTHPKPGGTTRPKTGGNTHPKPGGTTRPKPGRTTRPKPGGTTRPKTGGNTHPKPGGTTRPKPGGTTKPKPPKQPTKPHSKQTTQPPATQPTATQPRATQPPATQPPATQPPATQPPATKPPATQPPASQPPATQPPATQPPATQPPSSIPTPTTNWNLNGNKRPHHHYYGGYSHGINGPNHISGHNIGGYNSGGFSSGGSNTGQALGNSGYGAPCHTHGGFPCCNQHSGDRSIDVSVKIHIGRDQLKGCTSGNCNHQNNVNQGSVLSVTNSTSSPSASTTHAPTTKKLTYKVTATTPSQSTSSFLSSSTSASPHISSSIQQPSSTPSSTRMKVTATTSTLSPTTTTVHTSSVVPPSTRLKVTATTPARSSSPTTKKTMSAVALSGAKVTATTASKPTSTAKTSTLTPLTAKTSTLTNSTQAKVTTTSSLAPSTTPTQSTTTSSVPSATSTASMSTPAGSTEKPHQCYICNDPLCSTQTMKQCGSSTPYCMSTVDQFKDGTRTFSKGCVSHGDCEQKWWRKTSGSSECMAYMDDSETGIPGMPMKCSFCCVKDGCNEHVQPADISAWYLGNSLPPKG